MIIQSCRQKYSLEIDNKVVDLVLLMSVNPGKYGQPFMPESFQKLTELRDMSKDIEIEVDGGVNLKNAKVLRKLGADILVSGATIFTSKNIKKTIQQLKGLGWFNCKKA